MFQAVAEAVLRRSGGAPVAQLQHDA